MSDPRPFARSSISSVGAEVVLAALPALSRRGGRSSIRVFTEEEARAELAAANRAEARLVAMGGRSLPWSAPATARRSDRNSRPACKSSYNATRRVQWKLTLLVQDTIFAVLRGQDAAITSLGAGRP